MNDLPAVPEYHRDGDPTERLLLELIHAMRVTTRAELAEITRLSPSTVSKATRRLLESGLIAETGTAPSTGGRPAVQLVLQPAARYAIGAEFSLHRVRVAITDLYGAIQRTYDAEPVAVSAAGITQRLIELIQQALDNLGRERVVGVGIAVPGVADPTRGVMEFFSDLNLHQYPLGQTVEAAIGIFPIIYNRVIAAAMGEKWQGDGQGAQDIFYLSLGTGIGGGLLLHGEPHRGASMAVGEIGHITVVPNGPLCFCGNRGCLQTVASSVALASRAREEVKRGYASSLVTRVDDHLDLIDGGMVLEEAATGDVLALQILSEAADAIAIAVGNVINLLSPELVVLGGPLIDRCPEPWVELIRAAIYRHTLAWPMRSARVVVGRLGNTSRVVGAAALAIRSWLKPHSLQLVADHAALPIREVGRGKNQK